MYYKCFSRCLGNKSLQKFCDVNSDCVMVDDYIFLSLLHSNSVFGQLQRNW